VRAQAPCRALYLNHVWTYDFVEDATERGTRIRGLTVCDEASRRGLATELDWSFPARRVQEVLEQLFARHGAPQYLRSDNGPEFIAGDLVEWLAKVGVKTHHIDPGSPWQNAYGESFNATFRRECLDCEVFHGIEDGRVKARRWLVYYNTRRPHSSLGYLTPEEFAKGVRRPLLDRGRPSSSSPPPFFLPFEGGGEDEEGRGKRRQLEMGSENDPQGWPRIDVLGSVRPPGPRGQPIREGKT